MNSLLVKHLFYTPSNFIISVNNTVFAGRFKPIANVSVTNIIFIKSNVNSNSINSLIVGIKPE